MATGAHGREQKSTDRNAKLEALHEKLTDAVESLVTGTDWRKAIEFNARFRARSFRNCTLIAVQHAEAHNLGLVPTRVPTYVAGFRQWQSQGRTVSKGQHGYQIFAPVTGRFASGTPSDPDTWRRLTRGERSQAGETVRTKMIGLRLAYVFDISQTEGDPIPTLPRPIEAEGAAPRGLWDGLVEQVQRRGFELRLVPDSTAIGGADGLTDYTSRQVSVRSDIDDLKRCLALCHELAHSMLHGSENPDAAADAQQHRGIREVEAESVSLFVAAAHGVDTSTFTVPYISAWATKVPGRSPVEIVQATAERVRTAAVSILDDLDTTQVGNGDPPGLTRDAGTRTTGADLHTDRSGLRVALTKQEGL